MKVFNDEDDLVSSKEASPGAHCSSEAEEGPKGLIPGKGRDRRIGPIIMKTSPTAMVRRRVLFPSRPTGR
jgi:hypothetical protein